VSLEAVIAMSLICGVIVAAIGYDRRGLSELFGLLTRLDEILVVAAIQLWRSN
jgi:Na+-transporting NADH:ubiquinone oxidoreductase subunit NqrC